MEAALDFLRMGSLKGKTVAVQGIGNVGGPLVRFLFEKGVGRIVACDIDARQAEKLSFEPHPIFGHRGRQIIDSLVADRWQELA